MKKKPSKTINSYNKQLQKLWSGNTAGKNVWMKEENKYSPPLFTGLIEQGPTICKLNDKNKKRIVILWINLIYIKTILWIDFESVE